MNAWLEAQRQVLLPLLPYGAFLKIVRSGEGLWITNAPLIERNFSYGTFVEIGFIPIQQGDYLRLTPSVARIRSFANSTNAPSSDLSKTLERFRNMDICPQAIHCFLQGARILAFDNGAQPRYDQNVRQLAAFCLRNHLGGAYVCARLNDTLLEISKGDSHS